MPSRRSAPLLALLLFTGSCAAADGPRSERLTRDVEWLADDAREGRRAGEPGEAASARYLAQRLEQLGLAPAGEDGFFQRFPVPLPPRDGGASSLVARAPGGEALRIGAITPLFCSAGGSAKGPLAFRGYGIQDEERQWLDYGAAGDPPPGYVALVVRGVPRGAGSDAPADDARESSQSAGWGHGGSLFHKVMTAKLHGAAAVVVCQHPSEAGEPLLPFDTTSAALAGIPALMIRFEDAERLVPDLAERVRALDAEGAHPTPAELSRVDVELSADVHRDEGTATNVLGRIPGRGGRTVVVGAHFDHLGRGGPGSLAPDAIGEVHNGADDNASGVAVALEVARELAKRSEEPAGDVLVALWSGEELGLLGSEYWCEHPTVPLDTIGADLNLDMVGRAANGHLVVLGAGTSPAFAGWMAELGKHADLTLQVSLSATGLGGSDHQSFVKHGIPALHLFSGLHPDYHKPSDDAVRFEAEGAAKVATLATELVERMQAAPELPFSAPPAEAEGAERPRGFSVRFGTVPDYAFEGPGMRLSGTSPDSPAERAGLFAGDVLVRVDDVPIGTLHDFVYVLQIHKPGDVVRARYLRDGVEHTALVTLESREVE